MDIINTMNTENHLCDDLKYEYFKCYNKYLPNNCEYFKSLYQKCIDYTFYINETE